MPSSSLLAKEIAFGLPAITGIVSASPKQAVPALGLHLITELAEIKLGSPSQDWLVVKGLTWALNVFLPRDLVYKPSGMYDSVFVAPRFLGSNTCLLASGPVLKP